MLTRRPPATLGNELTEVKGGLLLDVVVREGATVLKLLASEDQTLLVGRDTLLVLDFGLDVVDSVGGFDLESDSLAGQSLDENLHSTTETEDQVEGRLLLDIAAESAFEACSALKRRLDLLVTQGAAILELLASEDETLLVGGDAFLVLDLGLDIVDGIRGLDLESDGLSGEGLNKDLHAAM